MRYLGTITCEDYWAGGDLRTLADELLAALCLDADDVVEMTITPSAISVVLLNRRTGGERTVRYPWGSAQP